VPDADKSLLYGHGQWQLQDVQHLGYDSLHS
jgi:hypothetical protein